MTTKSRPSDKGAFQLSISLIIVLVFAVVLLALSMTWLRSMIVGIFQVTDDLVQDAQEKLTEAFQGGTNFAVWPASRNIEVGKGIKTLAGVMNNAPDGNSHNFVINVIPVAAGPEACPEQDVDLCTAPDGSTMREFMRNWLTFDNTVRMIQRTPPTNRGTFFLNIQVPGNAVKSTYIFNVVACYGDTGETLVSGQCTATSQNLWGGSAQQIVITAV